MKDRIYISGPITGLDYKEASAAFYHAEREIMSRYGSNVDVVNPVRLVAEGVEWKEAMKLCLVALLDCTYIHMLPGAEKSEGARLELMNAAALGLGLCNSEYELVKFDDDGKKD